MKEKELKCKLEEMASGMGYEVKKKFKQEIDPIYKIFQLLIIFGFLTVFTIMGTYLTINLTNKTNDCSQKIIYVDRIIETEKQIIIPKTRGLTYFKTVIRNGREYRYYKKVTGDTWEFYTVAPKIKTCQK